jgi:hypothetical protein
LEKEKTARDVLEGMRWLSEERLRPLRSIDPSKPLSAAECAALADVIDDVRVLWKIIGWLHNQLQSVSVEAGPAVLLFEVFMRASDQGLHPEELWKSFVKDQTQYLAPQGAEQRSEETDLPSNADDLYWQ